MVTKRLWESRLAATYSSLSLMEGGLCSPAGSGTSFGRRDIFEIQASLSRGMKCAVHVIFESHSTSSTRMTQQSISMLEQFRRVERLSLHVSLDDNCGYDSSSLDLDIGRGPAENPRMV